MKAALLLLHLAMPAHDFYDEKCCSETHCHPVPCEEVTAVGNGWEWHGWTFKHEMLQESPPDGQCHVCIAPSFLSGKAIDRPTCIYLPPRT